MKINVPVESKRILPPNLAEVCVLKDKGNNWTSQYLVFRVPGPHPVYLFVDGKSSTYLPESGWERHVNEYYDHVGTFKTNDMEVTFNA